MKPYKFQLNDGRDVELKFISIDGYTDKPGYDLYLDGEKIESEVPIEGTWNYSVLEDRINENYGESKNGSL